MYQCTVFVIFFFFFFFSSRRRHTRCALVTGVQTCALPIYRETVRRTIGAAQALRLALLQHMFLKAVSIPAFSRANDISRDDVQIGRASCRERVCQYV